MKTDKTIMTPRIRYFVMLPLVLAVTVFLLAVPAGFFGIDGLTVVQQRVIALFVFAALMWMTEIIPSWTTSLLVLVLALLTISDKGIGFICNPRYGQLIDYKHILSSFADPVVMLFLGGFVLAIVAEEYGLDVTLARFLLKPFGKRPRMVLLGFLLVISVFSMFMSNTATAAMMLALLTPVLASMPADDPGKGALVLAIPLAANLGGIGTPIGTPPNATAVRFMEEAGNNVTFMEWCVHMMPFVLFMVLITWLILPLFMPFKSKTVELKIPESSRAADWRTWVVWITFVGTILLWATESLTGISSNIVAMIPLGVLTVTGIFGKEEIRKIDWTVLWLVAGGFALGTAMEESGLANKLLTSIPFGSMKVLTVILLSGFVCYLLSTFISNSATAAMLIPIMLVVARGMSDPSSANGDAFLALGGTDVLIAFVAMSASLAMIFPISTPPNAIAAGTGLIRSRDMARVGLLIGIIGFVVGFVWMTKIFPF
ncbi:MAG: SLC13 family permease [Bacteroidales bacterium]|nr:SLC13 family permease [Bacteroidales bacterium]